MITYKNALEIQGLRESGKLLVSTLLKLIENAKAGVALKELDKIARMEIEKYGGTPAFLNYKPEGNTKPFPAAICTSLNNEIVHGVPDKRVLKDGDILKIDIGVVLNKLVTDAAVTIGIGEINKTAQKLIEVTRGALNNAIEMAKNPDARLGDIGWIIEKTAEENGFSVVDGLTGHGVGFKLHEEPTVYNYGKRNTGLLLKEGLVIAIEPMLSAGSPFTLTSKSGSFLTKDGSLAAHFEKTIAITKNGIEILTPF
jgi:methionyl aminopeptidase